MLLHKENSKLSLCGIPVLFRLFFFLLFNLSLFSSLHAQSAYFQQHVSYNIKVRLSDTENILRGDISIDYRNNSTDTLYFIYMHLWPNAYSGRNTALSRQMLESGNKKLYFAKEEDRGFIDSLNFSVNGSACTLKYDSLFSDIGKIILSEPLVPAGIVKIVTPFRVKIPSGKFSRLGHIGQSYQVSQWYPKPAVYDQYGWHQMPYLNQGEFYSEYGSFKVEITLPQNYLVASTGILQEQSERDWLLEKALATGQLTQFDSSIAFPLSSEKYKTITFVQDSIHDFAWFADKRFNVLMSEFTIPGNNHSTEAWVFFTNDEAELWKSGATYVESGIKYYSKRIGNYPYSHFTIVDGTISAGGGMEYPMITVIGDINDPFTLEDVIVHELGHSWFYALLGSNERLHGWMDEGMNTAYEAGYIESRFPGEAGEGKNDLGGKTVLGSFIGTDKLNMRDALRLSYQFSAFNNSDQPIETPSEDFKYVNYGTVMYGKTALAFGMLEDYLGTEMFDNAMHRYFDEWKYRHPYPEDLKYIFESVSGKNLSWFFNDFLTTNGKSKYKIKKFAFDGQTLKLNICHKGEIIAPLKIREENKFPVWIDGFENDSTIILSNYTGGNLMLNDGYVELFKSQSSLYRNCAIAPSAPKIHLQLIPHLNADPNLKPLLLMPMVAWNRYNNFMAGVIFSDFSLIPKRFEFTLVPLYDFSNNGIAGTGSVSYHIYPLHGLFSEYTFSTQAKRFAWSENTSTIQQIIDEKPVLNYTRIAPELKVKFRKHTARSTFRQQLVYRNVSLWVDNVSYNYVVSDSNYYPKNENNYKNINELIYSFINSKTLDPYEGQVRLENGKHYTKLSGEFGYRFSYAKFNKGIDVRLFAGGFLDNGNLNNENNNFRMGGWEGKNDYLFEEIYFGRSDYRGLWKQQFVIRDGGFKTPLIVGQSNKWIASLNVDVDLPVPIPVSLFSSIGTYEGIKTIFDDLNNSIMFEGGIAIKPIRNVFEIYIPLFYSKDIDRTLELNNIDFIKQVRFVFNISKITPYALRNNLIAKY